MVEKMEMSLDDIIKSTKSSRPGGRRGRGSARGSSNPRRGGSNLRGARVGPGAIRRRSATRGGGPTRTTPYSRGDVNSKWQHDMFDGAGMKMSRFGSIGSVGTSGPTKLLVSNLDFGVSNSDIQELFAEFGPLKSASVHYDRSGRSLGSADVIFERKADAIKAMKQYHGVPLDGRAMNIQMAISEIPTVRTGRVGFGSFSQPQGRPQPRFGGGRGRGGSRGGIRRPGNIGARGGARGKGKPPTAEELDAELDAYVNKLK